jgi:Zn-dependent protease
MFLLGDQWLLNAFVILIPLWLSLGVHEWAHAYSAKLLGDDTAALLGRATLNPLMHIDPIGSLILPLLGVPFGWAKPVPINPLRFRRDVGMRTGILLVAAAGPASNIVLAIAAALSLGIVARLEPALPGGTTSVLPLFEMVILLNVVLAFFNLVPIPPLDGSRIVDTFVPDRLRPAWDGLARCGPIALVAVIVGLPLLGINVLGWAQAWAQRTVELALP